jgi:hypothetical protein
MLRAAILATATALSIQALADAGRFHLVAGDVTVVPEGGPGAPESRRPVTGDPIPAGDRICTGADGRAQVGFSEGSIVSVQPGSRFRADTDRFDAGMQRGIFSLVRGSLRTLTGAIGKRDGHDGNRLITPTATLGARGTEIVAEQTV